MTQRRWKRWSMRSSRHFRTRPRPSSASEPTRRRSFCAACFDPAPHLPNRLLGRHSEVTTGGELEFLPALVQSRLQPYPAALARLDPALIEEFPRHLCRRTARPLSGRPARHRQTAGQFPSHRPHQGDVSRRPRVVHTRRNALDNIVSIYFLHFDFGVHYGFALDDIAHLVWPVSAIDDPLGHALSRRHPRLRL